VFAGRKQEIGRPWEAQKMLGFRCRMGRGGNLPSSSLAGFAPGRSVASGLWEEGSSREVLVWWLGRWLDLRLNLFGEGQ
jgi:hypothetical protein